MPEYAYKGRDKDGRLKTGERFAENMNVLNAELIKDGLNVTEITVINRDISFYDKFSDWLIGQNVYLEELGIFARQMQILHQATVPMTTALKQLAANTRSRKLARALNGVVVQLQKGQSLSAAMQHYSSEFSPMMISLVEVGETTGHLSEAFGHIYEYLEFETSSIKQVRSSFRYPIFVIVSVIFSIIILNVFVIPSFAKFYTNVQSNLPWQTQILITTSNIFVKYGYYLLGLIVLLMVLFLRYIRTSKGKYKWNKFELQIPIFGKLLKRIILVRFCQSLAIMLKAQLSVTRSLTLIKSIIQNNYINQQINQSLETIERGTSFTQAIVKIDLFSSLEIQILSVGEKNGDLSPALNYISKYHNDEIRYDIKRMTDLVSPLLTSIISVLVLIIALGVYLPIWNMINLVHS